jgi:hypothetical protein
MPLWRGWVLDGAEITLVSFAGVLTVSDTLKSLRDSQLPETEVGHERG